MLDTIIHYFIIFLQVIIWIYMVGPFLLVLPAFQISYLGADIHLSDTKFDKNKYRVIRVLWFLPIIIWVIGFFGIIAYHAGVLNTVLPN